MSGATTPGSNGRIAFASTPAGASTAELHSVAADGTGLTRLTWSPTTEQFPAWSPDGAQIAFQSFAEGRPSIHVMNADGSGEKRLSPLDSDSDDAEPSWSPDGSEIAFASTRPWNDTWSIWVIGVDGSNLRRITAEFATAPAWSPDGTQIAYLRTAGAIAVVAADGANTRQVTFPPTGYVDERPSWSPDGSTLVFARRPTFGNSAELFVAHADGTGERQLTFTGGASRFPAWSPDGTQIVFTHDRQLHVIAPDGSALRPLLTNSIDALTLDWGTSTAAPNPNVPGAPRIQIFSPEARVYPAGAELRAFYLCESETSFVISCEGDVTLGGLIDTETTGARSFTVRASDVEGRTSTATVRFEILDWRAPTLTVHAPAEGAEYGVGETVIARYECADQSGGSGIELCDGQLQQGQPLDTSRAGAFTTHFWALDRAGNFAQLQVTYRIVERDRTPPAITVETPSDGDVFLLGATVAASYRCVDEAGGSGIELCHGSALDTATVGTRWFVVKARDRAGNTSVMTRTYRVVYPFDGFLAPLVAPPAMASVEAGEKVPVKFSLSGDRGLAIIASGSPTWTHLDCESRAQLAPAATGDHRLSFPGGGRYQLLLTTDDSWTGTCRRLDVTLDDGTTHTALVRFT
jgi:Tol biopolymer transport system component